MSRFPLEYIVKKMVNSMKQKLIFGTAILTISGLICRLIGFFYRIFLSRTIGAEGLGIYQLIVPLYHLAYAVSTAGIQTALSRLVASATAKKEHTTAFATFLTGTALSFLFSILLVILMQSYSDYLAYEFLKDVRCISLLKFLSYTLPFASLHGCVMGWFLGKRQIHIPAIIQVLEELIRFFVTGMCYYHFIHRNLLPTAVIALIGLFVSELFSVIVSILFIYFNKESSIQPPDIGTCKICLKELLVNSFPITLNRIALNLLHSIEAILIPFSLIKHHLTHADALTQLGIVSGMALPLVLFPTAIMNALSSVLLPAISEQQALEQTCHIRHLIKKVLGYAFFIGLLCTLFFSLTGRHLGILLYQNQTAGIYITQLALICPFLFCDIVLAGILNGLGKTFLCFFVNFINMVLRLSCIYFLIPSLGIQGYFCGLVGGEIFCTAVSFFIIFRLIFCKRPIDK